MAAESARLRDDPPSPSDDPEGDVSKPTVEAAPNPTELDQLIHGRVRLGIVSALAVHDRLSFTELRELLETSDGNLSAHARKLEDGGYLRCEKSFEDRVPLTEYRLTERGRRALERYLGHMEGLIQRVRDA
ncbi:MAG: transcriptional regulator [Gemmatimonadales bacterium]|nr:MAG: transcriptional regulator [Gemmatimonadales bacterium]